MPLIYQGMARDQTPGLSKLRRAFSSAPPKQITQEPFDSSPKHLSRLGRLLPGDRPEVGDLWEYTQDLLYSNEIQRALLRYLLPFCLSAWRDDLRGVHSGYGGFVEHFYPVLANKHIFDELLTPSQTMAVSEFTRASILEENRRPTRAYLRRDWRTTISMDHGADNPRRSSTRFGSTLDCMVVD